MAARYPTAKPTQVEGLKAAYSALALRALGKAEAVDNEEIARLFHAVLPLGNIKEIELDRARGLVGLRFANLNSSQVRSFRFMELEAALFVLLAAVAYPSVTFLDHNGEGENRKDYLRLRYVRNRRANLHRILANAYAGETALLGTDHYYLNAASLRITEGDEGLIGREAILRELGRRYANGSKGWGLSAVLSEWQYRQMVRGSLDMYDAMHRHHYIKTMAA